jgi:hypothetical protein
VVDEVSGNRGVRKDEVLVVDEVVRFSRDREERKGKAERWESRGCMYYVCIGG